MPHDGRMTSEDLITPDCTGCGACAAACPAGAVTMVRDEEGFPQPTIDAGTCVNCRKCISVCQLTGPINGSWVPLDVAACYAKDPSTRAAGSSGGVFSLLAGQFLSGGGIVYGAYFDSERKAVVHTSTDDVPLEKILRSKYAQSEAWQVLPDVRTSLRAGRRVLFCGTPCQVAGLKRYLGREYPGLLTVDFLCHGVPSPGVFEGCVRHKEEELGARVAELAFRDKTRGWREQHMTWHLADDRVVEDVSANYYYYYYYFLYNYSLRRSCYGCGLYERHASDITLADHWLVDAAHDNDKGVSLALANTEAGLEAMRAISGLVVDVPVSGFDISIYRHGYDTSPRDRFFAEYKRGGIDAVCGEFFEREHAAWERKRRLGALKGRIVSAVKGVFGGRS